MWELKNVAGFGRSLKKFGKKHRQEVLNALDNANAYLQALNSGLKPQQIERGFLHAEPHGVKAIDESGPGPHKKATRLYVYPDEPTEVLFLITIGDKDGQSKDIRACNEFVVQLLKDREQDVSTESSEGENNDNK